MNIGGLQKISLIDYPEAICAVIFSQGCNFRCPYCHNPELVNPLLYQTPLDENEVLQFLGNRRGKLDAITITGGEPTIQDNLIEFAGKIKKMGFAVKIDTNGSKPQILKALLERKMLDFIAMDIKAPLKKYKEVAGVTVDCERIIESMEIILKSGLKHEFRTTIVKSQLSENDILSIARMMPQSGNYVLQRFVPAKTLDQNFLCEESYSWEEMESIKKRLEKENTSVIVR